MAPRSKQRTDPRRNRYTTLRGWALGVLLESHAIKECDEHGHMRDRTDPEALSRARLVASDHPFPGATSTEAARELEDIMKSIGDSCPDCN